MSPPFALSISVYLLLLLLLSVVRFNLSIEEVLNALIRSPVKLLQWICATYNYHVYRPSCLRRRSTAKVGVKMIVKDFPLGSASSRTDVTEQAIEIAKSLDLEVRQTYDHAMLCCGQLVAEHDYAFGYLRESTLQSEETIAALLSSTSWVAHLAIFRRASEALASFNSAFARLHKLSGLETTGEQMAGYFLGGPTDQLLRPVRHALSDSIESRDHVKELATNIAQKALDLSEAMAAGRDSDRAAVHEEAKKLQDGKHESLEQVAAEISLPLGRRDKRAVAFVALALAGWEPDLNCWEKNIALVVRGERSLKGEYRLPLQLDRRVQNDILVGVSLDRRETYRTLDGTALLRVETLHVGQDAQGRYVRATEQIRENIVVPMWAPFERTAELDWETVKEFVAHTGPVRYEWTTIIKRMKGLGRACVPKDGMEVGKAFLSMSENLKTGSPNLYKIWERTMSQRSFTSLTCRAITTSAARAAVLERMILSTVVEKSSYHIASQIIHMKVGDTIAQLFDKSGREIFVDVDLENMEDSEAAEVSVKFFALLTRAMDGWIVKPRFYKDRARQKSVLRARGPRQGFDRKNETETENRSTWEWRQLCESPFSEKQRGDA